MRTAALIWVGGCAAWVSYLLVRSALLDRRIRALQRQFMANEHEEALQEDRIRRWSRANGRLLTDMWIRDVEAEVCDMGVFIPLVNPHDVAEFISASPIFTKQAA